MLSRLKSLPGRSNKFNNVSQSPTVLECHSCCRCGPIENVYLSNMKMQEYRYFPGENAAYFMNEAASKIAKDVTVRFVVIGTKWMEADRDFQALVSLDGDYLGPIASPDI